MNTSLRLERSLATQVVAPFTGEGAYHGSTKARSAPERPSAPPPPVVEEMRATTLELPDSNDSNDPGREFDAHFPNLCETRSRLPIPTQAEIRDDGVTFCWCPIELALAQAGPLTKRVLVEMTKHLAGHKRHVYIDSKIQYFEPGDVPVDSQHWHVDGSISVRGPQAERRGHALLHDMRARLSNPAISPTYLSYQSSEHCATCFVGEPVTLRLPELIPNFDELDHKVRALDPAWLAQPAGAIVRFDGLSLHRAVAAHDAGWRLWVRCVETDREVVLDRSIIECYGTVFRTQADA